MNKSILATGSPNAVNAKSKDVAVQQLSKEDFTAHCTEIASLYIAVFGDSPWYEKLLAKVNGRWERFGRPDELDALNDLISKGTVDPRDVRPFYTNEGVRESMSVCSDSKLFLATAATVNGTIIGVSWGMRADAIPSEDKAQSVGLITKAHNLSPVNTFYCDETFVDQAYRGIGVGKELIRLRGDLAIEQSITHAIVRTKNQVQVGNFMSVFGAENVREAYSNPNDSQEGRKYYLIRLMRDW
ncbi:MAG: hypothetical protein KGH64_01910 [Candidatus Micrarchaeota archaeon]|nr:hypothetical protein [Candidatus Micrarchaeota archaeon]MDE1834071.1 hypothetical protein [Candidatus Micrarchaeota archaeon]MDE1859671.1 hypothetical protein [Candidatus Micrarchaeota archaeon]